MITTITPLRRVAVTLVLTGATVFGAVSIAPAAFADETTTVTQQAPVVQDAPAAVVPDATAPAPDATAPAPDATAPAPDATAPAPEASTPAPEAPVVTPPAVVIGKDGKPVKEPKVCKDKDQKDYADKLAKANQQAAPLLKTAGQLRQASALLRAQAVKMTNPALARITQGLASVSDFAASKLEAQAADLIAKVGGIGCIVVTVPGGRF
jgi:hypothetical protein